MEDFEHAVHSLGQWSVDNLSDVKAVHVIADEYLGTAHVGIYLQSDTWDHREVVIDEMIGLREMYFDDFVVTYEFGEIEDDLLARADGATTVVLARA